MWELDYIEGWAPKNWCFWTLVLKNTLESPLDCKKIKLVNPKGNQSWIFIGRTDAEAETPILRPSDPNSWLIRKDPDAGKDWRWEEKGTTEDEMVEWHYQLNGHEFEEGLGDGEGQGSLVCCCPWGHNEFRHDWLNNNVCNYQNMQRKESLFQLLHPWFPPWLTPWTWEASVASRVVRAPGLFLRSSNQPMSCPNIALKPNLRSLFVRSSPDLAKAYP